MGFQARVRYVLAERGRWETKPYLKHCRNGICMNRRGKSAWPPPLRRRWFQSVPVPHLQLLMGEGHLTYGDLTWQEEYRRRAFSKAWFPRKNPCAFMGPWLECGNGICFASRQIVGSTPIGSTIALKFSSSLHSFPQDFSFLPGFKRAVRFIAG